MIAVVAGKNLHTVITKIRNEIVKNPEENVPELVKRCLMELNGEKDKDKDKRVEAELLIAGIAEKDLFLYHITEKFIKEIEKNEPIIVGSASTIEYIVKRSKEIEWKNTVSYLIFNYFIN